MSDDMWYKKQLRMVQTVLREPDIVDYDAKAVVNYLEKIKANCIIVNGGGIVDFFPNDIELANPNPFMGTQDILADLVREAHSKGIKVMVRVDFRGVEKHIYEQKPHWFAAKPDGSPVINAQGLYVPCYNSGYANEHAARFVEHIMSRYGIDGVWENALGFGVGPCYCKRCRELYEKEVGKEIPVNEDYNSPIFDEYKKWKAVCADRHIKLIRDTVKKYGEDKAYAAEIFGMFNVQNVRGTGIDLYNAKKHFDFLVSPTFLTVHNAKRNYDILSYSASNARFMKSLDKDRQVVVLFGNNGTRWRYIKDPTVESKIWLWEAVSVGAGFWNCMFNGQYPAATLDNRNAYMEKEVYCYLADNERLLQVQVPKMDIGIFYSKPTRDRFAHDDEDKDQYGVFIKGVERVLIDNHVQYNFCPDIDFSLENIKGLKALIVPNAACLSDQQIEIIKEYVRLGGGLIASYQTSLYDENGFRRKDFGLKELFGCTYTGIKKDTSNDCYQLIVNKKHPILNGFTDTSLIMNGGNTLLCTLLEGKEHLAVCTYVPIIPNQPPEKAWIKEMHTEYPTIIANVYGKGRVVYFANEIDKLCFTNGHEDFINIFYNAINWVKNGELSVETNAPDSIHINITRNKDDQYQNVLSLINLTAGPNRPIRQLLPVYNFYVIIKLPGNELKEFRALREEGEVIIEVIDKVKDEIKIKVRFDRLNEFISLYFRTA